jgi:2'-5' RNA ligase
MTKIRSFIAINLPPEIKSYLANLMAELKKKNSSPHIKWVNPEGLHLTLHFLGYLDEGKLSKVKEIINQSVLNTPSVEIELKGLGGFPNLNHPRVLFVESKETGDRVLKSTQEKIGQELEKNGFEIDKRPWHMHITLARLKIPTGIKISNLQVQNLKFRVKNLDLMKSELTRGGAHYSIITSFPLQPSL